MQDQVDSTEQYLKRIESKLDSLLRQRQEKEWYTTTEFAEVLGKAEYTVREWCRQGRIHAQKKGNGRGKYQSWAVSHDELLRFQRDGLIPER
jgi:hypothetical protein